MKIERIEIYGYGKWIHQSFEDLSDLQVFLGNNEAGKSTLSSFIHTIFFGFPSARKKDQNSYLPKQGEAYGGKILLSGTRFGEVWIERLKERNRGRALLTHPNGQQEVVPDLAAYLLGVDRETYELLYTFQIDSLLELNRVKRNDLNRYLLSVGTSGSEKLLQLADLYRKEAQKQFKPTGTVPPLNKKIQEAEKLQLKLQEAKQKNSEYQSLLAEAVSLQEKMEKYLKREAELEEENKELSESIRLNDYYREWLRLQKQVAAVDVSILPKDAQNVWERLQGRINDDLQKQTLLQERLRNLKKQKEEYTHAKWYQEHKNEMAALQHELTKATGQYNRKIFLAQSFEQTLLEAERCKAEAGIPDGVELQALEGEFLDEIKRLAAAEEQLKEQQTSIAQKLKQNEANLDSVEKRIQETKKAMVPDKVFQEWETQTREGQPGQRAASPATAGRFSPVLLLLAASAAGIGLFVPAFRLYAWVLAAAALGGFVFLQQKNKSGTTASAEQTGSAFSMQEYIQEAARRERLKELENEEEKEQELLIELLNEEEKTASELQAEKLKQQELLSSGGYPARLSLHDLLLENPAAVLAQKERQLAELQEELDQMEEGLSQWEQRAEPVRSRFGLKHLDRKEFLDQFSEIHQAMVLEESMHQNIEEQAGTIQKELEEIQQKLEENQQKRKEILQQAHVETEAEFYQLLHAKEEQGSQRKRMEFLAEQIEGKETVLEKYPDKEKAEQRFAKNKKNLQEIQNELKERQKEEVALRHDIELLEKGGTYSSLLQEYAMLETEMREMLVDWGKKVIAAEWVEDTLREGRKDRLPAILEDLENYFIQLTDGAYSRVIFQKSGLKVQHENGTIYQPFELSQGTVEQLYIALRFAFIKNTADITNLPILIDDGFVNFDKNRKEAMYQLMSDLSRTVQVFFFTFDETAEEFFTEKQITMLQSSELQEQSS